MNKVKKSNKILIALLITLFIILNIAFSYKIFAATRTEVDTKTRTVTRITSNENGEELIEKVVGAVDPNEDAEGGVGLQDTDPAWDPSGIGRGKAMSNSSCRYFGVGDTMNFTLLKEHGDLLCDQRGAPLKGASAPEYGSLKDESGTVTSLSDLPSGEKTQSQIYSLGHRLATPEEIFILLFATDPGGTEYTAAQVAWWNRGGGTSNIDGGKNYKTVGSAFGNDLLKVKNAEGANGNLLTETIGRVNFDPDMDWNSLNDFAKQFQAYIESIAVKDDKGNLQRYDKDTEDKYGNIVPEGYFIVDYNPQWDQSTDELKNPTVKFDEATSTEDSIIVGDFAIDYVYHELFAYITDMHLEINDPSHPILKLNEDFEIISADKDDYGFPLPGTNFKLLIKNKYNGTKITNVHVDFEFYNGKGSFDELLNHMQETKVDHSEPIGYEFDENNEATKWYYKWTKRVKSPDPETQIISGNIEAEIRPFHAYLDRQTTRESQIEIEKIIVDENGNPIQIDGNDEFVFELTVEGAEPKDPESSLPERLVVTPKNNKTTSMVYTWEAPEKGEEEKVPTFTISEASYPEGYKPVSVTPTKGNLADGTTIKVVAQNQLTKKTGDINIIKKLVDENGKEISTDAKFNFNVTIEGKFRYNGGEYKQQTVVVPVRDVDINQPRENILSGMNIEWYENAPTYYVEEVELPEEYKEVSILPSSGNLLDGGTINVTVTNMLESKKGKVKIIKTLENAEGMSVEELQKFVYEFKLTVTYKDGTVRTETIKLDKNSMEELGEGFRWVGESDIYKWIGDAPTYTIEETSVPEGTRLNEEKSQLSGTLTGTTQTVGVVENDIVNELIFNETGIIDILKEIKDDSLKDQTFSFVVTVTGTFRYNETLFVNQTIQLTNDGYNIIPSPEEYNTTELVEISEANNWEWTSKLFEWNESTGAPEYKVQENLVGTDINHTISQSSGTLADRLNQENGDSKYLIKIDAINGYDKVGYLHIIKTLDNDGSCPVEYIKSLVFKFKIIITRENGEHKEEIVALRPELKDNKWVWEYEQKYSWAFNEKAPTFSVEEIEIPEGVEFNREGTKREIEELEKTREEIKKLEGLTLNEDSPIITGTLIENTVVSENIVFTEAPFVNHVNERTGYLDVEKEVTDVGLSNNTYKFNVTLTSTGYVRGEYGGKTYETTNGSITIPVEVELKDGNMVAKSAPIKVTWLGNVAPTYVVEEVDSNIAELVSMHNETGTIIEATTVTATFVNAPKKVGGYLEIVKLLEGENTNIAPDAVFHMKVTLKFHKGEQVQIQEFFVDLKPNEVYKSDYIEWFAYEEAPDYTVEEVEVPKGFEFVRIVNGSGKLVANETVRVEVINKANEKQGTFKITKEIVPNKFINAAEKQVFKFRVKLSGTFEINGQMHYESDGYYEFENPITIEIDVSSEHRKTYTYDGVIKWWGEDAPTVTVEEIELPTGWKQVGSPSNNGAPLSSDRVIEIVVSNELPVFVDLDLTIELAGQVWEDLPNGGKNTPDSVPNGLIDDGKRDPNNQIEPGVKGVEVYVYRTVLDGSGNEMTQFRKEAKGYSDNLNATLSFPIITDIDGEWKTPRLEILSMTEDEKAAGAATIRYNVEFVYDGQTYEPTTFLSKMGVNSEGLSAYVEGSAEDYIGAPNSEETGEIGRDAFASSSMAKDVNRDEVNNRIGKVYGNTAINGKGETSGKVSSVAGEENYVSYKADTSNANSASRLRSELITTDENGVAYDLFKATASTLKGGLSYPFDNHMHLEDYSVTLNDEGLTQHYTYSATYNYCLHINLGLVRRDTADVEATKDLYSAKVIVDGKEEDYRFNKLGDLGSDMYERELSYELGLYKTDYYYRAEMYKNNVEAYRALNSLYSGLDAAKGAEDSELDVYLTYKIDLYNTSGNYIAKINSINDYFDSSFGDPISVGTKEVVNGALKSVSEKTIDNENIYSYVQKQEQTAEGTYTDAGAPEALNWTVDPKDKNIKSSDGRTYNKMSIDLSSLDSTKLVSGGRAEIFVTFNLRKDNINEVRDAIILGEKANIVEISSYTTYYKDKITGEEKVAGKIDLDSAPDNANIENYNEKAWFEDDTCIAPALKLYLQTESREVNGIAWEDKAIDEKAVGDGLKNSSENVIGGLTTELVEKISVNGVDYDLLWPTSEPLNCLGGRTVESLTGFASTTETSRELNEKAGTYSFTGVPTGQFVTRFLYGNDKTELEDQSKVTLSPAQALKITTDNENNVSVDPVSDKLSTSNYDGDKEGYTPAVYNGQDFKSTIYKAQTTAEENRNSDARDSESRRLEVIANSQTITNANGTILESANSIKENHTELYNQYSMYADTDKLNFEISANNEVDAQELSNDKTTIYGKHKVESAFNEVDFGLIERPENAVVLDKEIQEILLKTNDGRVIFDALYDIEYLEEGEQAIDTDNSIIIKELPNGKHLYAKATLNTEKSVGIDQLQAINKNETKPTNADYSGTQNFRFINVDSEILQGTTLSINYLITALNIGEADYIGKDFVDVLDESIKNITLNEDGTITLKDFNQLEDSDEILTTKQKINKLAEIVKDKEIHGDYERKYLGNFYDTGDNDLNTDAIVTTKVRQVVDYADNDSVFTAEDNAENDHIWRNTTITELAGSGFDDNRLLDPNVIPAFQKADDDRVEYIVKQIQTAEDGSTVTGKLLQRNNLLLSVDDNAVEEPETVGSIKSNAGFERELVPYDVVDLEEGSEYKSNITLTVSKTVAAQDDADNLTYDNITEIVKFENSVGRRDEAALVGNANPVIGEFKTAIQERDSSATELITFTPPTGNDVKDTLLPQILATVIVSLVIIATGVVVIKKGVLTK